MVFSGLTCIAFFVAVEAVLWAAGVATVLQREDPSRGFSGLVSVFERDGDHFRTRAGDVYETFNKQAFAARKPDNGLRLFCLGGSSAYGFPWGAPVAFTAVLGDVLADAHRDRQVEAINVAGVSYAMHRLVILANEIVKYEPDILFVYSGHNEFVERSFYEQLKNRGRSTSGIEYALSHSRLYSVGRALWHDRQEHEQSPQERFETFVRREQELFTTAQKRTVAEAFAEGLTRLVRLAQEHRVRVVLATVPCNLRQWRPRASVADNDIDPAQRTNWSTALAAGKRHLAAGDHDQALVELGRANAIAPTHAETHFLMGGAHEGLEHWEQARRSYRVACDLDASPVRRTSAINDAIRAAASERGTLLVDMDRIFEAHSPHGLVGFELIEDYVHPTPAGHALIAWHLWDAIERAGWVSGPAEPARADFDRVVAARPAFSTAPNATWFYNQGCILENQGLLEQAIAKHRRALSITPSATGPLWNLSNLLFETGQPAEAAEHLKILLRLDPRHLKGRILAGNLVAQAGRLDEAAGHYRNALRIQGDSVEAFYELGRTLQALGRLDEALDQYRQALRWRPQLAEAHFAMGTVQTKQGRSEQAIESYGEAVRIKSDHVEAYFNLGMLHADAGDLTAAARCYGDVLRLRPDMPEAHYHLAVALATQDKPQEALQHYQAALRHRPDWPAPMIAIAWFLATHTDPAVRNPTEAIRLATRASEMTGHKQPDVLDALAASLAADGQVDRAVQAAQSAIALARAAGANELALQIEGRLRRYAAALPHGRVIESEEPAGR